MTGVTCMSALWWGVLALTPNQPTKQSVCRPASQHRQWWAVCYYQLAAETILSEKMTILPVGFNATSQDANYPASPQPKPCVYVKICNSVSSVLLPFLTSTLGWHELACIGRGEEDD